MENAKYLREHDVADRLWDHGTRILTCTLFFVSSFILSGAELLSLRVPLSIGLAAACTGYDLVFTVIGGLLGAFLRLSGGEMLCQNDFAYALLRGAKEMAINTAVETTGFASWEKIERMLPYIDTVLMDIKHTDSAKHKAFTTQSNELILENAVKIAKKANKLIIRVPVIPTFNDTEEEIADIAKFTKSILPNGEIDWELL